VAFSAILCGCFCCSQGQNQPKKDKTSRQNIFAKMQFLLKFVFHLHHFKTYIYSKNHTVSILFKLKKNLAKFAKANALDKQQSRGV